MYDFGYYWINWDTVPDHLSPDYEYDYNGLNLRFADIETDDIQF